MFLNSYNSLPSIALSTHAHSLSQAEAASSKFTRRPKHVSFPVFIGLPPPRTLRIFDLEIKKPRRIEPFQFRLCRTNLIPLLRRNLENTILNEIREIRNNQIELCSDFREATFELETFQSGRFARNFRSTPLKSCVNARKRK